MPAKPGEFSKVSKNRYVGEVIMCPCGTMLAASPDDDIDPVKPGQRYDEALYHTFARPPKPQRVRQKTLARQAEVKDSIVIYETVCMVNNAERRLDNAEGVVREIRTVDGKQVADVVLLQGVGGGEFGEVTAVVPLERCLVRATATLRVGDKVRVTAGVHSGATGHVRYWNQGEINVEFTDGTAVDLPIERLDKIEE